MTLFSLQVRAVLYENGGEVGSLKFSAVGMTNIGWFSQKNLISSPWGDLKKKTSFQHFDIAGGAYRSFEITNNYGGSSIYGISRMRIFGMYRIVALTAVRATI